MPKINTIKLNLDIIRTDGSDYKQFSPEFTPVEPLQVEVELEGDVFIKPGVLSEEGLEALYVKLWKISSNAVSRLR